MRGVLVTAVLAGTFLSVPGDASPPVYYSVTTTLNGDRLPHATAVGEWWMDGDATTVRTRVVNVAPATTRVAAHWVTPLRRTRGHCFGQFDVYVTHDDERPPPAARVVDRFRVRQQGGRWSRWFTEYDEGFYPAEPDMAVGFGQTDDCMVLFRTPPKVPVQLEIRHVVTYVSTVRAEDRLTVTVP